MQHDDLVRAVSAAIMFGFGLAGHGLGDHWVQTSAQAGKKALDAGAARAVAVWHCAKHVLTWTATVALFVAVAGWWLHLPLRPGWVVAGLAVNAGTHFVADLRTPLRWLAARVGRAGYIDQVAVLRPAGAQTVGPGTGLFHLDQSLHVACLAVAALVMVGP